MLYICSAAFILKDISQTFTVRRKKSYNTESIKSYNMNKIIHRKCVQVLTMCYVFRNTAERILYVILIFFSPKTKTKKRGQKLFRSNGNRRAILLLRVYCFVISRTRSKTLPPPPPPPPPSVPAMQ